MLIRQELFSGIKAELPILIGVIPFGMIYGVLALSAGIEPGTAQAMSAIVFAGSAQFIAAQLVGAGAPGLVIVLTASIVNLRHALYSASVAPHLKKLGPKWKWSLAYLLTDEAYAVTITHYIRTQDEAAAHNPQSAHGNPSLQHWFFLGAGLALWTTWQISTAVGIFLGTQIPASWSLDFTLALTFIALLVPSLRDRPSLFAAAVAGLTALLTTGLPLKLGLVVASLAGIIAGLWSESRS